MNEFWKRNYATTSCSTLIHRCSSLFLKYRGVDSPFLACPKCCFLARFKARKCGRIHHMHDVECWRFQLRSMRQDKPSEETSIVKIKIILLWSCHTQKDWGFWIPFWLSTSTTIQRFTVKPSQTKNTRTILYSIAWARFLGSVCWRRGHTQSMASVMIPHANTTSNLYVLSVYLCCFLCVRSSKILCNSSRDRISRWFTGHPLPFPRRSQSMLNRSSSSLLNLSSL